MPVRRDHLVSVLPRVLVEPNADAGQIQHTLPVLRFVHVLDFALLALLLPHLPGAQEPDHAGELSIAAVRVWSEQERLQSRQAEQLPRGVRREANPLVPADLHEVSFDLRLSAESRQLFRVFARRIFIQKGLCQEGLS